MPKEQATGTKVTENREEVIKHIRIALDRMSNIRGGVEDIKDFATQVCNFVPTKELGVALQLLRKKTAELSRGVPIDGPRKI